MLSTYGIGRAVAAEGDTLLTPHLFAFDNKVRGVVYCHGGGGTALAGSDPVGLPGQYQIIRALAEVFPVLVCDLGGDTWGNATGVTRVGQAKTYLQGAGGAKAGPVLLVATSMGNAAAMNYAKANRASVAAVAGLIPVSDMEAMRTANTLRASIDAAWGVAYPTALPAGANPPADPGPLVGLRYQAFYATGDTVVVPSTVTALAVAIGGTATVVSPLNHSEAALQAVPVAALVGFLAGAG